MHVLPPEPPVHWPKAGQVSGGPPPHAARSDIQEPGSSSARPLPYPHVFFAKLRENLQRSCLRSFWLVSDKADAFVDQEKKKAFLAQVLRAPFPLDDSWKGQFLNHLRTLNPPAARQFDISSEVLDHLAMAVYRSDLPHPQVFKSPIQVHKSQDEVVAWVLPTIGFPVGSTFLQRRVCQESFAQGFCCQPPGRHWTCLPATGHWVFFGRATVNTWSPAALAAWCTEHFFHTKNVLGVAISGDYIGTYPKRRTASTHDEQRMLRHFAVIRGIAQDKRWVFRTDAVSVARVVLMSQVEDQDWGEWTDPARFHLAALTT